MKSKTRLTKRIPDGIEVGFVKYKSGQIRRALELLAEFEDIGMSPKEISSLKAEWNKYGGMDGLNRLIKEHRQINNLRRKDGNK